MFVGCVLVIQVVLYLTGEAAEFRENPSKKTQRVHLANDRGRFAFITQDGTKVGANRGCGKSTTPKTGTVLANSGLSTHVQRRRSRLSVTESTHPLVRSGLRG